MTITPLNNHVLLKPKVDPSKFRLENGQIFWIDTSYEKIKHSTVVCEVVATPDKLIYGKDKVNSMDWKTEMLLRAGDIVIIHFLGYQQAYNEDRKFVEIDGEECFFCPYNLIYLAKRRWTGTEEDVFWEVNKADDITNESMMNNGIVINGNEIYNVIMLNGYTLVQPVEKQYKSDLLYIPRSLEQSNKKLVKVCYTGMPNEEYLQKAYYDADVSVGDIVVIDKSSDVPLEYTPTFNGAECYWRVQNSLIMSKVSEYKTVK